MLLEELDKGGRTGKVEPVGDLLDSQVCGLEKHLRFNQYRLVKKQRKLYADARKQV